VFKWGSPLLWTLGWSFLFVVTGVMLKPEDEPDEPKPQAEPKGFFGRMWRRWRPYILPALYWNERVAMREEKARAAAEKVAQKKEAAAAHPSSPARPTVSAPGSSAAKQHAD
jgi:hypothetical protein